MNFPLSTELKQQLDGLNTTQSAFVAGYLWARSQGDAIASADHAVSTNAPVNNVVARRVTVLSASQTGNAHGVAKQLLTALQAESINAELIACGDYKARQLPKEDIVLLVTSTQGEGEPPEEGISLYRFLTGKKAPKLDGVSFAVFGLGDTSYPDFCQAGKDFDAQLATLGGTRLVDRVDADLDYQTAADTWIADITQKIKAEASHNNNVTATTSVSHSASESVYDKNMPYIAELLQCHSLVDVASDKTTWHIEIDLGESGLTYQAGDALGVVVENADNVVDEVLSRSGLSADAPVTVRGEETTLQAALQSSCDLNQLTPPFIARYREWLGFEADTDIAADSLNLPALLHDFPPPAEDNTLNAQALVDGLKPLTPRLYSIASSQAEVGEEVHLCVGEVAFNHHDTDYHGSATGLLSNLDEGDNVRVFVEPNPRFRLPTAPDTAVIMIGAGTGIAPFRGFMQQRAADAASGDNWLFFGNRHYRQDFLYQAEWIGYRDSGLLTRIDLAWSRDGKSNNDQKVYVQDKIIEQATDVWQWLENGAHIYVCGDAKRMAKDVEAALLSVIKTQGGLDDDDTEAYLDRLREDNRYQRDVY